MNAASLAHLLHGKRCGDGFIVRCPAHEDLHPSLSICDGERGLVGHCFAGCDWRDVLEALTSLSHLPVNSTDVIGKPRPRSGPERKAWAGALWQAAGSAAGSPVARYLQSRGLRSTYALSASLRCATALKHPAGTWWPAMLGKVLGADGDFLGVHRTYLAPDGSSKAAIEPNKMMLGPCKGGSVRLSHADRSVMVGEGIETCIAAMQLFGQPAWAALSAAGLVAVQLPTRIRNVLILADGDTAGARAAEAACQRMLADGRITRIVHAPTGQDFADVWMADFGAPTS